MIKHKFLTLFVAIVATTALWASNTITYTATEKLGGYRGSLDIGETTFGPAITSHDFSNGIGTITCSGEVTTIGEETFYGCRDLTSITIPNSVTTIGSSAFSSCFGLTSITIPNSVITIGDRAFPYCSGLTSIDVDAANTHYASIDGVLFNYAKDTLIQYPIGNPRTEYTIPNSVTKIGDEAFYECSGLTSVTIPNSVTTIGDDAFRICSGLTSVTIGNSVTTIGGGAFSGCSGLTSITIPNSVTTIEDFAFYLVNNIVYDGTATSSPWGAKCVNGYVDGYFVYGDADKTKLYGCSSATMGEITIPHSVITIGESAFMYCSGLTSITIPQSVTSIGEWAFGYCSGLTSVIIGNSVTTIENHAFLGCFGLTSIIIPNSVTTIGRYAFDRCSSLPVVDNVRYADTYLVEAVDKTLSSYVIKEGTKWIGDEAFYDCKGLTSITIPNSVKRIGEYAFSDCSNLTAIICEATTPPTCGDNCFYRVDKYIPLYVPTGSVDAYKTAYQWKDFTDIRPITAQEVEVTEIEAEPTESAVEIAWPSVVNAETYTIEIRLGDQLICSIIFNAEGQLVSINFNLAPGRGGHTYAITAENTATGWAYTIAGLNPGTEYTYSVIAKNADDQEIDTKSGVFSTKELTAVENINAGINTSKSLRNGQVLIRKDGKTYNVLGQEL